MCPCPLTRRKLIRWLLVIVATLAVSAATAQAKPGRANPTYYESAKRAVCFYFGTNCPQAMQIVRCETGGTYVPWAANGQYLGIFQMGSRERARFGHGSNVWAQAKAAYAYFRVAGWHPWLDFQPAGCGS